MTALDGSDVVHLVGALATADRMPAIALVIDRSDPDGTPFSWERHGLTGITIHPRILDEDGPVMAAMLAHEVAHHRPDRDDDAPASDRLMWTAQRLAAASTVLATLAGADLRTVAVGAVAAVVAWYARRLLQLQDSRREEFAADAHAVELLDAVGMPGRECLRAALERTAADEGETDRWSWRFSTHPTAAQRLAALDQLDATP